MRISSKYGLSRKHSMPVPSIEEAIQAEVVPAAKEAKVKQPKSLTIETKQTKTVRKPRAKQRPRALRNFIYNGVQFLVSNKGENAIVCIINPDTNQPELQVEVKQSNVKLAYQAISRIVKAELEVEALSVRQ